MWWLSLLQHASKAGQDRRDRESEGASAPVGSPATPDTTGSATDPDDRNRRRSAWGGFGRSIASRYLSGGE